MIISEEVVVRQRLFFIVARFVGDVEIGGNKQGRNPLTIMDSSMKSGYHQGKIGETVWDV